jgi:hypothetical protein
MFFKEIILVLSGLLTPVVACTTVYIAWQQYRVSRLSLRKDLYKKRLRVYRVYMSFLSEIVREGKVNYTRVAQFYTESVEADFLFDQEIIERAEEFRTKGMRLAYLCDCLYPFDGSPGLAVGEKRSRMADEEIELNQWFMRQIPITRMRFKEQMAIQEHKILSIIGQSSSGKR